MALGVFDVATLSVRDLVKRLAGFFAPTRRNGV
jgi:hypothetical protein